MQSLPNYLRTLVVSELPDEVHKSIRVVRSRGEKSHFSCSIIRLVKAKMYTEEELLKLLEPKFVDIATIYIKRGYLNIMLSREWVTTFVNNCIDKAIIPTTNTPRTVVVDYSSPNVAKEMHVGHLRSTIIGNSIANMLQAQGHTVHRVNHIGDFGLPFGMLVEYLNRTGATYTTVTDLQVHYKAAKKAFDENEEEFQKAARARVVDIQEKSGESYETWKHICAVSKLAYDDIYKKLDVHLEEVPESFYGDKIPATLEKLTDLAEEEEGRTIIKTNKNKLTLIKSGGGYTYDTTDLAALDYRLNTLDVDQVVYVVDFRQKSHFEALFEVAEKVGWSEGKKLDYVGFGTINGEDNKPIKSRDGDAYPLRQLMQETVDHSYKVMQEKIAEKDHGKVTDVLDTSTKVACNAIKFFDMIRGRTSDYVFNLDRMLDYKGYSGIYVTYGWVRGVSVLAKSMDVPSINDNSLEDHELYFAVELSCFPTQFQLAIQKLDPSYLVNYLYGITKSFFDFWAKSQVIEIKDKVPIGYYQSKLNLVNLYVQICDTLFPLIGMKPVAGM